MTDTTIQPADLPGIEGVYLRPMNAAEAADFLELDRARREGRISAMERAAALIAVSVCDGVGRKLCSTGDDAMRLVRSLTPRQLRALMAAATAVQVERWGN